MEDFVFTVPVGDKEETVEVYHVYGTGKTLRVAIGGRSCGILVIYDNKWDFRDTGQVPLTTDDIELLEEIVNKRFPDGFV